MFSGFRNLLRNRGLLGTLTARELKARYRGSVLGFLWSLVNPLILLAVYAFVFGLVLANRMPDIQPYAVFLICGLFPWIWASSSLLEGTLSLASNAGLIRKAVFPLEVLPVVSVLSNLVHFALALPIVFLAVVVARLLGHSVGGWWALLLPVIILIEMVMVSGMAWALAALNVHFKDVRDLLNSMLTVLFFLAPIIYPLSQLPSWAQKLLYLNPFTPFTIAYQDILFRGIFPATQEWVLMFLYAAFFWFAGLGVFSRLRETLAEAV